MCIKFLLNKKCVKKILTLKEHYKNLKNLTRYCSKIKRN